MYDKNALRDVKCTRLFLLLFSLFHFFSLEKEKKENKPFLPSFSIIHCHNQPSFFLLSFFHPLFLFIPFGFYLRFFPSIFFLFFSISPSRKREGGRERKKGRDDVQVYVLVLRMKHREESDEDDVSKEEG